MNKTTGVILAIVTLAAISFLAYLQKNRTNTFTVTPEAQVGSTFNYLFDSTGTLEEAENPSHSTSPYWWLNSGAKLIVNNGVGQTIHGNLPNSDLWRTLYAKNNSLDTDNGSHPQNLFRLITRSTWQNFSEQIYFKIDAYNLSNSPNRSESNGILLFSRYQDEKNLYYSGLRVDGTAVIKKKYKGTYYTLGQVQVFQGNYNRDTNPNLLPLHKWIGVRCDIKTLADGEVYLSLYVDKNKSGNWTQVLEVTDRGADAPTITKKGYAGIRTDFMDASLENFSLIES